MKRKELFAQANILLAKIVMLNRLIYFIQFEETPSKVKSWEFYHVPFFSYVLTREQIESTCVINYECISSNLPRIKDLRSWPTSSELLRGIALRGCLIRLPVCSCSGPQSILRCTKLDERQSWSTGTRSLENYSQFDLSSPVLVRQLKSFKRRLAEVALFRTTTHRCANGNASRRKLVRLC